MGIQIDLVYKMVTSLCSRVPCLGCCFGHVYFTIEIIQYISCSRFIISVILKIYDAIVKNKLQMMPQNQGALCGFNPNLEYSEKRLGGTSSSYKFLFSSLRDTKCSVLV